MSINVARQRSLSNVTLRQRDLSLPAPAPNSAPTTVRRRNKPPELNLSLPAPGPASVPSDWGARSAPATFKRRRHTAEQVFVSSTSRLYLNANGNLKCVRHWAADRTNDEQSASGDSSFCTYYNGSVGSSSVRSGQGCTGLVAKLRNVTRDEHGECQEVSLYIDTAHDPNHLYESLHSDDDFDSFDSDSDDDSFTKINQNDSGVDMGNSQLPEPPNASNNIYGLTRLAASAGKHMKRLRRNWSLTKNDISKSLSRMTKKKSSANLTLEHASPPLSQDGVKLLKPARPAPPVLSLLPTASSTMSNLNIPADKSPSPKLSLSPNLSNSQINLRKSPLNLASSFTYLPPSAVGTTAPSKPASGCAGDDGPNLELRSKEDEKKNSLSRKKNWLKFRRGMSVVESATEEPQAVVNRPKSTFYLTGVIDVDSSPEKNPQTATTADETKPTVPARRKSKGVTVRPQSPPPPAPTDKKSGKKMSRSTSWYAEVGLFKSAQPAVIMPPPPPPPPVPDRTSNTCWYAEVGLYKNAGSTPGTSSNENSGCSLPRAAPDTEHTTAANNDQSEKMYKLRNEKNVALSCADTAAQDYYSVEPSSEEYYNHAAAAAAAATTPGRPRSSELLLHQQLREEPLYQFYDAAVIENSCRSVGSSSEDSDDYEEIGTHARDAAPELPARPPAPAAVPAAVAVATRRDGGRRLWCEIPEVVRSGVLGALTATQRRLQEAKYELVTSEASYLNSLTVLEGHFMAALGGLVEVATAGTLFGKVRPVKRCSERLLAELESCWRDGGLLLRGVCDVVRSHADRHFQVYVAYCENQVFLDGALRKLRDRKQFCDALRVLEASPACQSLALYSFLMLPMQRITRLPLLVDAILKRLSPADDEYDSCQRALVSLNQIVMQCNEAARRVERNEETLRVTRQLEFPPTVAPLPPVGATDRWLVRSGELTQLVSRGDDVKLTFGKKFAKLQIHLFLFEDVLVIGKRKGEDAYGVIHHCPRSFVELTSGDALSQLPVKEAQGKHLLFLTLLENHEKKTIEMLLSCGSETDRQRWYDAFSPPVSLNPDETVYESWDCPQVTAVHFYATTQPDELALVKGDVVNVTRKMADGWYYGERMWDGQTGWFPGNHTVEIVNPHVRARNLKQRYRLLAFTGSYLNKTK